MGEKGSKEVKEEKEWGIVGRMQSPGDGEQEAQEEARWEWRRAASKIFYSGGTLMPLGGISLICFVFFFFFTVSEHLWLGQTNFSFEKRKRDLAFNLHNLNLAMTLKVNQFWKKISINLKL